MNEQTEIFKVQQDLSGNICLIYNKDRSILGQFPLDKTMKKILKNKMKVYAVGYYNEKTTKTELYRRCTEEELEKIDW